MNMKPKIAMKQIEPAKNAASAPTARTRKLRAQTKRILNVRRARNANLDSTKPKRAQQILTPCAYHARAVRMVSSLLVCARLTLTHNAKRAKFAHRDNTFLPLVMEPKTQLAPLARHLVTVITTRLRLVVAPRTAFAHLAPRVMPMNTRPRLAQPRTIAFAKIVQRVKLDSLSSSVALGTVTLCAKRVRNVAKEVIKLSPVERLRTQSANCARSAIMTLTKFDLALLQKIVSAKPVLSVPLVRTKLPPALEPKTHNARPARPVPPEPSKFPLALLQATECAMSVLLLVKPATTKPRTALLSQTENALLVQSAKKDSTF